MRPLELTADGRAVEILDQARLPHEVARVRLETLEEVAHAIRTMQVRGAPLIGITAAHGLALALRADPTDAGLEHAAATLAATRPTAVNLRWALDRITGAVRPVPPAGRAALALAEAGRIAGEEVAACRAIGEAGLAVLRELAERRPGRPLDVLTHCNAGWLATLEYGTALAPVYRAREEGLPVHVWVDETRPRGQGWLTAWELGQAGVPHTVVADTAAGWLFRERMVDVVLVGADRVARNGDVCNKVGTSLVALAAREAGVPFYAAAPASSVDWTLPDGGAMPIEQRDATELTHVGGRGADGRMVRLRAAPPNTAVMNPAFDVTPAALLAGIVTERGVARASAEGLRTLFPERFAR